MIAGSSAVNPATAVDPGATVGVSAATIAVNTATISVAAISVAIPIRISVRAVSCSARESKAEANA